MGRGSGEYTEAAGEMRGARGTEEAAATPTREVHRGPDGTAESWTDKDGYLHRTDGPAEIIRHDNGTVRQAWFEHGIPTRVGGPQMLVERADGTRQEWWRQAGEFHRIDGPAISDTHGGWHSEEWYEHGQRHREDGPAVVQKPTFLTQEPYEEYWLHGKQQTPVSA